MKKLSFLLALTVFLLGSGQTAFAEFEDFTIYNTASPIQRNTIVVPLVNDLTGYEYIHGYAQQEDPKVEFTHLHTNPSSSEDSVIYTVSVTESASATVSVENTFKAMLAEANVGSQVSLGVSTTKSLSMTWSIPANSTYLLRAGSMWMKAGGTEKRWENGRVMDTKSVTGDWTYMSWSDKVQQ